MPLTLDDSGVVVAVRHVASPNCDERAPGTTIDLLVIHSISLPPGEFGGSGIIDLFTNKLDTALHAYYRELAQLQVSAHFLIRRNGELIQFVPCGKRAWHAGVSCWRGRSRCNDFSLGIELEGCDDLPFEEAQYERLVELIRALNAKYAIADIVGHCDIAPGRKTDPGPCFEWARLRQVLRNQ